MIDDINKGFLSIDELIDNISRGGEVEFEYRNKKYSITHTSEAIHVMEFNNYNTLKVYNSAKEIISYRIGEERIKDLLDKIKVTFRCFQ